MYVPIPDSNIAMAVNCEYSIVVANRIPHSLLIILIADSDTSAVENHQSFHSSLPSNHLQTHHPVFSEIPSSKPFYAVAIVRTNYSTDHKGKGAK